MSNLQPIKIDSLLLDLFQELRQAGMALTLEQYDLLRKAITLGYGLGGWQDIKRVCRLLWVKPCPNYDINIFDRTFESYIQQHDRKIPVETEPTPQQKTTSTSSVKPPSNLPQIPPRKWKFPSNQTTNEVKVPVALKTSSPLTKFEDTRNNFHLNPTDFPIKLPKPFGLK
ncbi:MAG: hypothetical protein AAF915_22410 [Cyanobacteria bacterium P01_D01_bin.50]